MSKTEVILTKNVGGLGAESDKVEVAAGYARNYLLPLGKAISASAGNERYLAVLQARRTQRETKELELMGDLKAELEHLLLVGKVKTGEGGKMFGSVTVNDIVAALQAQGIEVDRRKIILPQPIKTLGEFSIVAKLYPDVQAEFKLNVQAEA